MRIGMFLSYAGGFREAADEVVDLERAGVDLVVVPEVYTFDAVSQLGFLAARTTTMTLMSGILQLYTRTPSLTAMTAAGLDFVSDGRFELGIGASGPQVIEGFHGVPYDAPLQRTREIVDICRSVWRRERLVHDGRRYRIPLPADQGTGLGKPLKLINEPVRERIPITIASLGPKSVEQTAEIAEGWLPMFFHPERAEQVWGSRSPRAARGERPNWASSTCSRARRSRSPIGPSSSRPRSRRSSRTSRSTWAGWGRAGRTSTTTSSPGTGSPPRPNASRTSTSTAGARRRSPPYPTTSCARSRSSVRPRRSRVGSRSSPAPA
nr:LLM class flavin-dependent oxidoreductase [Agromyces marinus]